MLGETNKHGANMKNMASSWQCLAEAPRHLDGEASDLRPLLGIDLPDPWGVWLEAGDSGDGDRCSNHCLLAGASNDSLRDSLQPTLGGRKPKLQAFEATAVVHLAST